MKKEKKVLFLPGQVREACIKSVLAGIMIGISGTVYLSVENKLAGSFLFSFGLITIVTQGLNLYTGLIGYVTNLEKLMISLISACGNFVGVYFVAVMDHFCGLSITSAELWQQKLALSVPMIFCRSIFCGILMFLAVDGYKKKQQVIYLMMPVMIFILAGFDHSVANMFYFALAGAWSVKSCMYLLLMAAGNAVGALGFAAAAGRKEGRKTS